MAMKHAMDYLTGLRYKLRLMGIPVVKYAYIYDENKSILENLGTMHSQRKKKSNSGTFHHVCGSSVLDE